ncbi:RidA family protein [Paenarthrobacter sp. S56]|uniref:RidA family protein n=1 Tax=Paenarthrobacter sp. S56 TaxID=3138179 RepID=UPI00321C0B73
MTTLDVIRTEVTSPSVPAPRGHFSHAVSAGDFVYVSGLLALDHTGAIPHPGDIQAQTTIILEALESILEAAGSSPANLIKLTVYVTDIQQRAAVSAIRAQRWPEVRPASTLVEVRALAAQGAVIEIDAVAIH